MRSRPESASRFPTLVFAAAALVSVLHPEASIAQCPPVPWSKTIGGDGDFEMVLDLHEFPNGDIGVAAVSDSPGSGSPAGVWFLRLDPAGNVLSQRFLASGAIETIGGAEQSDDGTVTAVGSRYVDFNARHGWITRLDAAGNVTWTRSFYTGTDYGRHFFYDVARTTDGGAIAVGSTGDFDFPPVLAWVVRTDSGGATVWKTAYGVNEEEARAVVATREGDFVFVGKTAGGAGSFDGWIVRLDTDGNPLWGFSVGGPGSDEFEAVAQMADGGFYAAGTTDSGTDPHAGWVVRFDRFGIFVWQQSFGAWSDLHSVVETSDGLGVLVAGRVGFTDGSPNAFWVVRLRRSDGAIEWQRAFRGDAGGWGNVVLELANGDVLAGGASSWGFPGQELRLVRFDPVSGLGGCPLEEETRVALMVPLGGPLDAGRPVYPGFQFEGTFALTVSPTAETVESGCDACRDAGGNPPAEPSAGPAAPPLRVRPLPAAEITVEEVAGATSWNVYSDRIGSWYFPSRATGTVCAVPGVVSNGDGTVTIPFAIPSNSWIVAVAANACGESSAGRSSAGTDRYSVGTWERCPVCP